MPSPGSRPAVAARQTGGMVKASRWGKFLSRRDVTGSGGVESRFSDPRGSVCTSKPPALRPHTPRRTHAPKPWRVFRCRCRFFLPFFQPVHADHARRTSGSDRQSRHRAGAAAVKISSRARSRQLSGLPLGLHFCGVSCCKGVGGHSYAMSRSKPTAMCTNGLTHGKTV